MRVLVAGTLNSFWVTPKKYDVLILVILPVFVNTTPLCSFKTKGGAAAAVIEASQPSAASSAARAAAEAKTAAQDAERNIRNKQRAAGKRRMGDD